MDQRQYSRRQALLFQINTILEKWPDRSGEEFTREMRASVQDLEALIFEVDDAGGDCLERARSWRHLGNAYFHLGAGFDANQLMEASFAYMRAETLLEGIDHSIEKAKLAYSFGHTLLALSRRTDLRLVEEARQQYELAFDLAQAFMPEAVETILKALTVENQLADLLRDRQDIFKEIAEIVKAREETSPDTETLESDAPQAEGILFERLVYNIGTAAQVSYTPEGLEGPLRCF
jgi:hypothetical protein